MEQKDKKSLRKADFITAVLILAGSVFFFIQSYQLMQRSLSKGNDWYLSAGLVPMLICSLLFICGIILLTTALKSGVSFHLSKGQMKAKVQKRSFLASAFIIFWFAIYIFVLLEYLPYVAATILFMAVFIIVFAERNVKKMLIGTAISIATTAIIAFCFGTLVGIPLP